MRTNRENQLAQCLRHLARVLASVWAGWWIFFGLASSLAAGLSPAEVLLYTVVPGLIFLVSAVVLWQQEVMGGLILLLEGLIILIGYPMVVSGDFPPGVIIFVVSTMALPPLISGFLCLTCWQKSGLSS
jgi:hypothetical protein